MVEEEVVFEKEVEVVAEEWDVELEADVLWEVTVVVVVTVLVTCPTAKYRLADISTPAITMAEAMAR